MKGEAENNGHRARVALIHAVTVAIEPTTQAFREVWPEADCFNILDDALSRDRAEVGSLSDELHQRIGHLADYAVLCRADAILYTCSAFGAAIEAAAARMQMPVLKPNEAMFVTALRRGSQIGMIATFEPSVAGMEEEFFACARQLRPDATLETVLADGAMAALQRGDADSHNRSVAERASQLEHCDAVMLAHFSTSRAQAAVAERLGHKVLTSPGAAVEMLKQELQSTRKGTSA